VAKSIQEWMREGDEIYNSAVEEFKHLEDQLADLEQRVSIKQTEVNQIAQMIGKPAIEASRRVSAHLVDDRDMPVIPNPHAQATIARALTGKGLAR
jgi:hypothetical protein